MKTNSTLIKLFFVLIFCFFTGVSLCYSSEKLINDISSSINTGNSSKISAHFAANVELSIPGNEGTFSKSQATVILRNFFNQNPPGNFSINHRGSSRDGSKYAIGTYTSNDGKRYRAYFLIKKVSNNYMLHQLQFELQ